MLITVAGSDAKLCKQLQELLAQQSHRVAVVTPAAKVLASLKAEPPQLLVLAEPVSREMEALLRSIREEAGWRSLPILCLDPRAGGEEGVAFLDAGADDFLNRPFNPQIFLARVRTLLRRQIWAGGLQEDSVTSLECGALAMKLVSRSVTASGSPVLLTRLEFDLLAHLMRHVERVFKREELLEAVWNYPQNVETRTLDKHVETLRRKLGRWGACIQTVHGVGYRLAPLETRRSSRVP